MTRDRRAILLTMAIFMLQPLAFGAWLALIPVVKANLGLDKAQLAIALLGLPVASLPSLQLASRMLTRFGPRRILFVTFPIFSLLFLLPLNVGSQGALFGSLMLLGVAMAFMQTSLNVYAGRLEKSLGVYVMSRCHGLWAMGLMLGSLSVAWLSSLEPTAALLSIGVVAAVLGSVVSRMLPKLGAEGETVAPPRRQFSQIPVAIFFVAAMAVSVGMTEGAMADWGAVYLSERLSVDSPYIGIGVSIYAGCLAAGRLLGDWLNKMIGTVQLARLTIAIAIAGLGLLVLPLPLAFAFVGFAFVGFGASVGFPLAVSAVASLDDTYESANIAVLTTISISGFLVGPPLIGFLAEAVSLQLALAALIPGLILGIVFARHLKTN